MALILMAKKVNDTFLIVFTVWVIYIFSFLKGTFKLIDLL